MEAQDLRAEDATLAFGGGGGGEWIGKGKLAKRVWPAGTVRIASCGSLTRNVS